MRLAGVRQPGGMRGVRAMPDTPSARSLILRMRRDGGPLCRMRRINVPQGWGHGSSQPVFNEDALGKPMAAMCGSVPGARASHGWSVARASQVGTWRHRVLTLEIVAGLGEKPATPPPRVA